MCDVFLIFEPILAEKEKEESLSEISSSSEISAAAVGLINWYIFTTAISECRIHFDTRQEVAIAIASGYKR